MSTATSLSASQFLTRFFAPPNKLTAESKPELPAWIARIDRATVTGDFARMIEMMIRFGGYLDSHYGIEAARTVVSPFDPTFRFAGDHRRTSVGH